MSIDKHLKANYKILKITSFGNVLLFKISNCNVFYTELKTLIRIKINFKKSFLNPKNFKNETLNS